MSREEIIKTVVNSYLKDSSKTIQQVSEETGISKSSIQRYLNDSHIRDIIDKETLAELQSKKIRNKADGKKKGGINSFLNNVSLKNKDGKFIGSKKYEGNKDRLKEKYKTILELYKIIFSRNCNSLDELTCYYNGQLPDSQKVTKDYVYDCLTSDYLNEVFDGKMHEDIQTWLNNNRELGNKKGANIINSRRI